MIDVGVFNLSVVVVVVVMVGVDDEERLAYCGGTGIGSPNLVRDGVAVVVVVVCVVVVVVTVGVDDEERQRWSVEARVWVR